MPPDPATVDFVADILCPWCFIARRRLDAALADLAADGLALAWRWRPFLLRPAGTPALPFQDTLLQRFGSPAAGGRYLRGVEEAGRAVGITFRYDLVRFLPDTRPAQALLLLAWPSGRQAALAERLAAAFFTAGEDLGDPAVLDAHAVAAGLPAGLLDAATLADLSAEIAAGDRAAKGAGLRAVPAFCLHNRILSVPDPAELASVLRSAHRALA